MDLIVDTIDPVSAMKRVICVSILAAKRMHMGSPVVAAHTSGAFRFSVWRVIVREMTVRGVWALVKPT